MQSSAVGRYGFTPFAGSNGGRNSVPVKASGVSVHHHPRRRRPENVDGEFFVDHTCIDCDACRWMAPQSFTRVGEQSAVFNQPSCGEERLKALQALLSCPTASIHTEKPPHDILEVQKTFPLPIDEQRIPGVYHCGYHSKKSFGAASYLIVHPDGNILVDSPSYKETLAKRIEMLGGARYMFLTHKDDVADHDRWAKRLNCERILHSEEVQSGTSAVEMQLQGEGPWSLGSDFELIFTPGHTEGCMCLLYKPLKVLFSGDHFANSRDNELTIFENYNWYSVPKQIESVRKLLDYEFEWILPGHGRRAKFRDTQEKDSAVKALLTIKEKGLLQLA
ncbi:hypothetical protein H6P81_018160 [Aristolochia fimbriata]|uniref:Metallo-beta-lactamase domain-containing protein n=1 Tax=Aristolochia fimbriata TaxID=158543 RepID=A0AAV7E3E0_ARIFI|nr:hypothetical protein H6P81_018160 [Aristolochia fimbriata]